LNGREGSSWFDGEAEGVVWSRRLDATSSSSKSEETSKRRALICKEAERSFCGWGGGPRNNVLEFWGRRALGGVGSSRAVEVVVVLRVVDSSG
jgi:hypothetical protein